MSSVADVVELDEARVKRGPVKDEAFESAGEMLKAAREASGMSIEDVSNATNVREDHIISIEAMTIGRLPVAPYTIGFVKAYGELMDLPVDALVSRFRKEAGYTQSTLAPHVSMPEKRDLAGGRELSLLAVVAIMAFILWVFWQVLREPEPNGPVQIAGTPLQERPIAARDASYGGGNDVPVATPEPNRNIAPIPGMTADGDNQAGTAAAAPAPAPATTGTADTIAVHLTESVAGSDNPVPAGAGAALAGIDAGLLSGNINAAPVEEPVVDPAAVLPSEADSLNQAALGGEPAEEALDDAVTSLEDVQSSPGNQIVGAAAPETGMTGSQLAAQEVVYTDPVRTSRVSPIYPRRCERLSSGTETVVVTYDITSRGQPTNVRVTDTTNDCFNAAAVSAVGRWSFQPATRNGSPIPVYTRSTRFRFDLPQ